MMGLLGDGWFYISAGGFLVSAVLFVFLLGQYRAAVEAEDEALPAEGPEPVPLTASPSEKVYTPKVAAAPEPVKSVAAEPAPATKLAAKAPEAAPAPKAEPAKVDPANITFSGKKSETTTGGISPAVVYLQNMKLQMDRLDKDITGLKSIAAQQNTHTDLILKKLSELSEKVAAVADVQRAIAEGAFGGGSAAAAAAPASAPAEAPIPEPEAVPAAPAPAPEPVRTIDLQPEPAPEAKPEPKPEPKPKKAKAVVPEDAAPDKTLVIEPTVAPIKLGGSDVPLPARPGFEEPKAETPAPAAAPSIELKPINGSEPPTEAPKPARKGPVWPI